MDGREYMYVRTALSNFELVIIRLLPSSLPSSFSGNSCTFMVMARQPKCHSRDATGSRNDLTWPDLIRLRFYSAQSQCQWGRKEGRKEEEGRDMRSGGRVFHLPQQSIRAPHRLRSELSCSHCSLKKKLPKGGRGREWECRKLSEDPLQSK